MTNYCIVWTTACSAQVVWWSDCSVLELLQPSWSTFERTNQPWNPFKRIIQSLLWLPSLPLDTSWSISLIVLLSFWWLHSSQFCWCSFMPHAGKEDSRTKSTTNSKDLGSRRLRWVFALTSWVRNWIKLSDSFTVKYGEKNVLNHHLICHLKSQERTDFKAKH